MTHYDLLDTMWRDAERAERDGLTDNQRFWLALSRSGEVGVHSWDFPRCKNVSQRAKDVTSKGQQVYTLSERRNGRAGARYWLEGFQPSDATAVRPNNGAEGGARTGLPPQGASTPLATPLNAEPVALFDPYTYERRGRYGREEEAA